MERHGFRSQGTGSRLYGTGTFRYKEWNTRTSCVAEPPRRGLCSMFTLKHPVVDIAIVCSDFEESLRFYHEVLGLEIVMDFRIPEKVAREASLAPRGFRQVRLKAGETLIKLMDIDAPPPARTLEFQAGVRWLTFIIDDVAGTVAKLKEKGVECLSAPATPPDVKSIVCLEAPDGIMIEFVQVD